MKVVLHLGAHKTATTHLQKSLRLARDDLRQAGVQVLVPADLRKGRVPLLAPLVAPDRHPAALAHWAEAFAGMQAARLLVSEENLIGGTGREVLFDPPGRLYPRAEARLGVLLGTLGGGPVTLALAVREPAAFLASAYGQQLSEGAVAAFPAYAEGLDLGRPLWGDLVRRLLALEAVRKVLVWRYEDLPQVRPRVLRRLLGPGRARLVPDPAHVNAGWTAAAMEAYQDRAPALSDRAERVALVRSLKAAHPKLPGTPGPRLIDPAQRARSEAGYRADLADLARLPGVVLLEPAAVGGG